MPKQLNQQQVLKQQQFNQQQRIYPSNLDPSLSNQFNNQLANQINQSKAHQNQFQISDTQPRQPFCYNLNQPVPALLNQRIHPAEMNNLDSNNFLIQPKPVPTVPQMPNLMSANLMNTNRYVSSRNSTAEQSNPPILPAKTNTQWANSVNPDCPPKAPPRRKSFASGSNTYLNKKGQTNHVKVKVLFNFDNEKIN